MNWKQRQVVRKTVRIVCEFPLRERVERVSVNGRELAVLESVSRGVLDSLRHSVEEINESMEEMIAAMSGVNKVRADLSFQSWNELGVSSLKPRIGESSVVGVEMSDEEVVLERPWTQSQGPVPEYDWVVRKRF